MCVQQTWHLHACQVRVSSQFHENCNNSTDILKDHSCEQMEAIGTLSPYSANTRVLTIHRYLPQKENDESSSMSLWCCARFICHSQIGVTCIRVSWNRILFVSWSLVLTDSPRPEFFTSDIPKQLLSVLCVYWGTVLCSNLKMSYYDIIVLEFGVDKIKYGFGHSLAPYGCYCSDVSSHRCPVIVSLLGVCTWIELMINRYNESVSSKYWKKWSLSICVS